MTPARCVAIAILLTLLQSCQRHKPTSEDPHHIRVAAILSISGKYSSIDVPTRDAVQLWVDRYTKDHTKSHTPVDLVIEDAGSDPIRAVERVETLWSRPTPPEILLLSTSSIAMAVTPHLRSRDVLVIANAGHPDLIDSSNAFTFSTFPDLHDECGLFTARLTQLKAGSLFIVHASDVYHQADAALLKSQFQGRIVGEEQYAEGTTDFSQVVGKILDGRPDAVALFGFGISYPALQSEIARRGYAGELLVDTDYLYNDMSKYPTQLLPRTTFVGPASLGERTSFESEYLQRYGTPMPYFASFIVDGVTLAVEAAGSQGTRTAASMTQYLLGITERTLLSGTVSVRADHHFSYRLRLYRPSTRGFQRLDLPR
jgi:ABC-type branched-subunit amino acid transport system substrate-binding protein